MRADDFASLPAELAACEKRLTACIEIAPAKCSVKCLNVFGGKPDDSEHRLKGDDDPDFVVWPIFDAERIFHELCEVAVVADDWGGLFEQPAHLLDERHFDFSVDLPFALASDAAFSNTDDEVASNKPSSDPATRAKSGDVATLRRHADMLAKGAPALFASRAPRSLLKYQLS